MRGRVAFVRITLASVVVAFLAAGRTIFNTHKHSPFASDGVYKDVLVLEDPRGHFYSLWPWPRHLVLGLAMKGPQNCQVLHQ